MSALRDDSRLDLLLADAEERRPVLEEGLPGEAAQRGPRPREKDSFERKRTDADPNDLKLQRWAVVAPKGREGSQLLEAIAPLIRLREAEQGAPVKVYRVPPDMDARQAVNDGDYRTVSSVPSSSPDGSTLTPCCTAAPRVRRSGSHVPAPPSGAPARRA